MKQCDGCAQRCELGYTIGSITPVIAPRVGDVTYWTHDMYASGLRRDLHARFVGSATEKSRLQALMIVRAKDIARYCKERMLQK